MGINEIEYDIREYLYYRFIEQIEGAGIDFDSPEMNEWGNDFNANFNYGTSDFKINYYKYAPNVRACLDKARKITEDHWHVKIEWE